MHICNLSFKDLNSANISRLNSGMHPACLDWTLSDWMLAVTGEVGEAANLIKKMNRGDGNFREEIMKEFADVVIYLDILSTKLGYDLGEAVKIKFNEVSERNGSTIKL